MIRNGTQLQFYFDGTLEGSYDYADISTTTITGSGNDDTLIIDNTNGNAVSAGGLSFDGGAGTNTIIDQGGNFATGVSTPSGPHSGTVVYAGGSTGDATVTYSNLSPYTDSNAIATFTVNGTANVANDFVIGNLAAGDGTQVSSSNGTFELWNLTNKTEIDVDGQNDVDTFTADNTTPDSSLTTLVLNGGTANGDTVSINATAAGVNTNWVADGSSAAVDVTVNVGDANGVQDILGNVSIQAPGHEFNTVTVDDVGDTAGQDVTFSSTVTNSNANVNQTQTAAQPWGVISGLVPAPADLYYAYSGVRPDRRRQQRRREHLER